MPSLMTRDIAITPAQHQGKRTQARAQVESYCQPLVDAGKVQWRVNGDGVTELRMHSGEVYLFGEHGITRIS